MSILSACAHGQVRQRKIKVATATDALEAEATVAYSDPHLGMGLKFRNVSSGGPDGVAKVALGSGARAAGLARGLVSCRELELNYFRCLSGAGLEGALLGGPFSLGGQHGMTADDTCPLHRAIGSDCHFNLHRAG